MENINKTVRFGTKQEAIITPKEGFELESVTVMNTADESVIESELIQISDNPLQWRCSFIQPAAHVTIKPVLKPVLYSVSFVVPDECNIVLVEQDSLAEIEIKSTISEDNDSQENVSQETDSQEPEQTVVNDSEDFNHPQCSFENNDNALDIGADVSKVEEPELNSENANQVQSQESDKDLTDDNPESNEEVSSDVPYDAGAFAEELVDFEPSVISPEEYDRRNTLYWRWKEEYDTGKCSKEKFLEIQKKHLQFIDDINSGKIIVK